MATIQGDHYAILGLTETATSAEIAKAYKLKALEHHPDKNPDANTTKMFQAITEANTVLSDAESRVAYDKSRQPKTKAKSTSADPSWTPAASANTSPVNKRQPDTKSAPYNSKGSTAGHNPQGKQIPRPNMFQHWMPPDMRAGHVTSLGQQARNTQAMHHNVIDHPNVYNPNLADQFSAQAEQTSSVLIGQQPAAVPPNTPNNAIPRPVRRPMIGLHLSFPRRGIGHVPTAADGAVGHAFPHPISFLDMAGRPVPLPPVLTPTRVSAQPILRFPWAADPGRSGSSSKAAKKDGGSAP